MIKNFAKLESLGSTKVLGFFEADNEGPVDADFPHQELAGELDGWPCGPTSTSELHIDAAGQLAWQETMSLPDLAAAAVAQTYKDVDAVYTDAIGAREPEYKDAEIEARRFAAAGFVGPVNTDISSYAEYNPTGQQQTNRWAAEQILMRADAFAAAKSVMRSTRFACQAQMQGASTVEQLATVVAAWRGFIEGLRAQLGLPAAAV